LAQPITVLVHLSFNQEIHHDTSIRDFAVLKH
jgi:hypothetical protein